MQAPRELARLVQSRWGSSQARACRVLRRQLLDLAARRLWQQMLLPPQRRQQQHLRWTRCSSGRQLRSALACSP
jgi:hypothetical protein